MIKTFESFRQNKLNYSQFKSLLKIFYRVDVFYDKRYSSYEFETNVLSDNNVVLIFTCSNEKLIGEYFIEKLDEDDFKFLYDEMCKFNEYEFINDEILSSLRFKDVYINLFKKYDKQIYIEYYALKQLMDSYDLSDFEFQDLLFSRCPSSFDDFMSIDFELNGSYNLLHKDIKTKYSQFHEKWEMKNNVKKYNL